ncbi:MAG: low molecular weight phosphotyrosine protein phosphatase [Alphaproteobacteria bacterium]|nr:low molecular weight phosphotyrosine protein phosphatase [Alphaproteobacteria bacterium]
MFVCTGNICRSPTAEGVFRRLVTDASLFQAIDIDSAGTHDYHRGEPPDPRARRIAAAHGYDHESLRARPVVASDFSRFTHILGMDRSHVRILERRKPAGASAQIRLFLDGAPHHDNPDVPDPYYGGDQDFADVLKLIEVGSRALLARLRQEHGL